MMKSLTAALVLVALAIPAAAQSPAVQRAADDLAALTGRVADHEQRIAALEQRAGIKADMGIPVSGKRDYATAYRLALSRNLPLLTWNGSAICESCIHQTDGTEFISYVGTVDGCPANAITVSVPQGGELVGVGVVDQWITNDQTFGHLPSVRRLLQRWRNRGFAAQPEATTFATYTPAALAGYGYGRPMMTGMMSGAGGGGCASCGGGGGVGLFRRR
jgi:hypothetical protein